MVAVAHIQLQPPPTSTEELPPPTLLTLRLLHPDTLLPLQLLQLLTSSMGTATTREGGGGERGGEADQDGPGREDSDLQPEEGVRSDLNEVAKGERREGE